MAPGPAAPLVRTVPCVRYLKYLFALGRTVEQVEQQALDLGLLYGGEEFLKTLQASLAFPVPFRPNQSTHPPSVAWLEKHGLAILFPAPGPPELRDAVRLIQKPRAKEILETLLLAGATRPAVAACLEREKIEMVSPRLAPEEKRKAEERLLLWVERLFWDVGLMDSTELKALLLTRTPSPGQQAAFPFLADKFKKAAYGDPRLIMSHMPKGPAAVMLAQARLGMPMSRVDLSKLYEMLETLLVTKAFEVATSPHNDAMIFLAALMSAAKTSADLREKATKPADTATETVRSTIVKYRKTGVYDVNALTGGNHRASPYIYAGEHQPRDDRAEDATTSGTQAGGVADAEGDDVVRGQVRVEEVESG